MQYKFDRKTARLLADLFTSKPVIIANGREVVFRIKEIESPTCSHDGTISIDYVISTTLHLQGRYMFSLGQFSFWNRQLILRAVEKAKARHERGEAEIAAAESTARQQKNLAELMEWLQHGR